MSFVPFDAFYTARLKFAFDGLLLQIYGTPREIERSITILYSQSGITPRPLLSGNKACRNDL